MLQLCNVDKYKSGPGFLTPYAVVFFMFSDLNWEIVVRFADIGGIVVQHRLTLFFYIMYLLFQIIIINKEDDENHKYQQNEQLSLNLNHWT
jgi:hypothetical protein